MTTDEFTIQIVAQLNIAKDYTQVDHILTVAEKDNQPLFKDMLNSLQEKLENLSPLDWNSSQWSISRYALICVHGLTMMQPA